MSPYWDYMFGLQGRKSERPKMALKGKSLKHRSKMLDEMLCRSQHSIAAKTPMNLARMGSFGCTDERLDSPSRRDRASIRFRPTVGFGAILCSLLALPDGSARSF